MEKLRDYRKKRDFKATPEPEPQPGFSGEDAGRFVIQEHHARRLHWDFRLETEGVLKSWALPKGPPQKKGERRLAVQVEDHPLEYLDFAGEIPPGNYGAGEVKIWDRGLFSFLENSPDKIKIVLMGERLQGAFLLVRRGKEQQQWLMLKYM
ncbi:MAG: DNA polymerase ligase N-terminal domain-containing protein [Bacillota bacterium]